MWLVVTMNLSPSGVCMPSIEFQDLVQRRAARRRFLVRHAGVGVLGAVAVGAARDGVDVLDHEQVVARPRQERRAEPVQRLDT